jgi:hypothetical protein
MSREWTRKDVIELFGGITITLILMVILAITYTHLHEFYIESTNKTLNLKAYCDSIGGELGGDKCYKDGEEMILGGEK